jgi:hypothetical protein
MWSLTRRANYPDCVAPDVDSYGAAAVVGTEVDEIYADIIA